MSALRRGLRVGEERLRFRFDGREIAAQAGDSVASALLASGVYVVGRSVKYRRRRGVFTAGPEEPNALFSVGRPPGVIPNVAGTGLAVTANLDVRSQNRWPTLHGDVGTMLVRPFRGLLGAGFYYKTFIWPSWRTYEGSIRRMAGLGEAPTAADVTSSDIQYVETDVLVAGAGPAGLAAAVAAARAGARVVVCERESACGGELEFENATIEGCKALDWVAATLQELDARGARILNETAVIHDADGLVVAHQQRGGLPYEDVLYRIRPKALIVAMGTVEQPIAFVNNDLPSVMLMSAAERYLARYGARVGSNLVLFGNHDRLYASAARFVSAGMRVRAIVDTRGDTRPDAPPTIPARFARALAGVRLLSGHAVLAAHGGRVLRGVSVGSLTAATAVEKISCDALLVSGGWMPAGHAGLQDALAAENAGAGWRFTCGASGGDMQLDAVLLSGYQAGRRAARSAEGSGGIDPAVDSADPPPNLIAFSRSPADTADEKRQFVDLQNDVTVADLRQALAEGFIDIEHVKRYTTLGVGTEQGGTSAALGTAIIAELSGGKRSEVGRSRARPPYRPVSLVSLCGRRVGEALRPERRTPLHDLHESDGAVLEAMGQWMRPRYYAENGPDSTSAGLVEAGRVRAAGGILDASTIGKIEVVGADAVDFLDSLYLTPASTVPVGRSRYGVNLREDGMVLDDGLIMRLTDERFLLTVSSGHALRMLSHFELWRDLEWSGRAVTITDVTDAWAIIVVAGPESRKTLQTALGRDWEDRFAGLGRMDFAAANRSGKGLRVLRASFTGELAYELHCRPSIARSMWRELRRAGLRPYGVEALDILRIEKGYLSSPEINGQTTPQDLGFERLLRSNDRCLGGALLNRPAFAQEDRPKLVGLRSADGKTEFFAGAQVTTAGAPGRSVGHITSATRSPALGETIGLGLVARSESRPGNELVARDPLRGHEARITASAPVHFDAGGCRMKQ